MNNVHDHFVLSSQCMDSRYKVFGIIGQWIDHLKAAPEAEIPEEEKDIPLSLLEEIHTFLNMEQETWSLFMILYYSRLACNPEEMDFSMAVDMPEFDAMDETPAAQFIIDRDRSIKEVSQILDWLESNVSKKPEPDLVEKYVSWEQTLETLKRDNKLGANTKPMITGMDPDACYREGKEVHPFDAEDEMKIQKGLFHYVRSGQPEKAITFLHESGHVARAAMLNGYLYTEKMPLNLEGDISKFRVHDQENMTVGGKSNTSTFQHSTLNGTSQGFAVSGNTERDLWKSIAFEICEENGLSKYERAALGALCGHRQAMLDVAVSWEDKLWAYLKAILDVRVETELRRLSSRDLVPLPDAYFGQDTSLVDCICQMPTGESDFAMNVYSVFQLVQRHVIIDDIPGLLQNLRQGITQVLSQENHSFLDGHLLRFLTHLLFVLGILELPFEEDLMNMCTETYVKILAQNGRFPCIPFYVDKLSSEKQIKVITDQIQPQSLLKRDNIEFFMQTAHVNNLDILNIGISVVTKLRDAQEDFDIENLCWITSCYSLLPDSREVMLAFIRNSIIIIRKYLILNNLSKCNQLIRQINDTCISEVLSLSEEYEDTLVREYLCYKTYLEAEDTLVLWQRSLHQKPNIENLDMDDSSFQELNLAERTLREKKRSDLKVAEEKMRKAINHYAKNSIEKFITVLKFPNGWLVDCVTLTNEEEFNSVKAVRRIILPKVVFILMKLIIEQNLVKTMRNFVYTLCEDHREILKEFTTTEISSIFKAVEESVRPTQASS